MGYYLVMSLKDRLLESIVSSGEEVFYRHQQREEPELEDKEKLALLEDLLANKPSTFLQRHSRFITRGNCTP